MRGDDLHQYTFAHSIDNSSGNSNGIGIQNPKNLRLYRGNSDFDVRHSLVLSWSYDLPFGRGNRFANEAHGLLQMVSSLLNSGNTVQWPDRVGSGKLEHRTIGA